MQMLKQLIKQLKSRISNLVTIAEIVTTADLKQVKVINDDLLDDVPHHQNYGFRSRAKKGAKAIKLDLAADSTKPLLIIIDDKRYHFTPLKDGEIIIESENGDKIHLKNGNVIDIVTKTLNITAPKVNITGDLAVAGNISDISKTTLADLRAAYNQHGHPGDSGGQTGITNTKVEAS